MFSAPPTCLKLPKNMLETKYWDRESDSLRCRFRFKIRKFDDFRITMDRSQICFEIPTGYVYPIIGISLIGSNILCRKKLDRHRIHVFRTPTCLKLPKSMLETKYWDRESDSLRCRFRFNFDSKSTILMIAGSRIFIGVPMHRLDPHPGFR